MTEPARALRLAETHHRLRPGGSAALLLTQAHMVAGNIMSASKLMGALLKTPYRSTELHATAATLYEFTDNFSNAQKQELLARQINPAAMHDIQWLHDRLDRSYVVTNQP